jgi:hypothetical protein
MRGKNPDVCRHLDIGQTILTFMRKVNDGREYFGVFLHGLGISLKVKLS